jgi:hypothetical protein
MAQFQEYNFKTLIAGAYYNGTNFTLYSDKEMTNPIDVSGSLITMDIRPAYNLPIIWRFSNGAETQGDIEITDGSAGKFSIIGMNMDLPAGKYVYDISILFYTGELKKYIRGEWIFVPKAG